MSVTQSGKDVRSPRCLLAILSCISLSSASNPMVSASIFRQFSRISPALERSPCPAASRAWAIASAAWSLFRCLSTSSDITTCPAFSGLLILTSLSSVIVS
ncbi:hypothetical protein AAHE18_18G158200 [Arachis hypogaea]